MTKISDEKNKGQQIIMYRNKNNIDYFAECI